MLENREFSEEERAVLSACAGSVARRFWELTRLQDVDPSAEVVAERQRVLLDEIAILADAYDDAKWNRKNGGRAPSDLLAIKRSFERMLRQSPGERPMLPGFGCDLERRFGCQPPTGPVLEEIRDTVLAQAARWIPEVDVSDVMVQDVPQSRCINVGIEFTVLSTNSHSNIVCVFDYGPDE